MIRRVTALVLFMIFTSLPALAEACTPGGQLVARELMSVFSGQRALVRANDGSSMTVEFRRDGSALLVQHPEIELSWFVQENQLCSREKNSAHGVVTTCARAHFVHDCTLARYILYDKNGEVASSVVSLTQLPEPVQTAARSDKSDAYKMGEALGSLYKLQRGSSQSSNPASGSTSTIGQSCKQQVAARALYCKEHAEYKSHGTAYYLECNGNSRLAKRACRGTMRYESTVPLKRDPYYCDPETREQGSSVEHLVSQVCE